MTFNGVMTNREETFGCETDHMFVHDMQPWSFAVLRADSIVRHYGGPRGRVGKVAVF